MPGSSPLRHLPSSAPQPHASPPSARTLSPAPGTPGGKRHGRRACESCRASKQRCSFLTPEGEDAGTCSHCQKSGAACIVAHPAAKIAGTASQGVGPGHSVPPTPEGANSVLGKRRRACESCRTSKAKCIFEAENDSTCKNCAKAKRTCVVELDGRFPKKVGEGTGDGTEKRRKVEKGDEKTVVMENAGQLDSPQEKRSYGAVFPFLFSADTKENAEPLSSTGSTSPPSPDVIDRGIISIAQAEHCFLYFINHQSPRLPWLGFPQSPSFSVCREQRPFLFLAIIAVGAGSDSSDLQAILMDEFYKFMADLVIYRSQRRCDIVHAILICTLWTPPPDRLEDLRYSTNIHLAASIASDIIQVGPYEVVLYPPQGGKASHVNDAAGNIESWRISLACFAACSMVALTLGRPSVLRFSDKYEKSLGKLLNPDLHYPDNMRKNKVDGNWIRLHRIEEALAEAKDAIPSETGSGNPTDILTTKHLLATSFEGRLKEWRESLSEADTKSESLMIEYHFMQLQTALLAMTDKRHQLGFPFTTDKITIPSADITNVGKSVRASRAILDIFLKFQGSDIPTLPSMLFPRLIYSIITLVKVAKTMGVQFSKDGHGEVVEEDVKNMKVLEYCDRLTDLLNRATGPRPGRSFKIIGLLSLLKRWYIKSSLDGKDAATKQKGKKKTLSAQKKDPQPQIENHFNNAAEPDRDVLQRSILLPQTPFNTVNSLSPSSSSFKSISTPTTQEHNDSIHQHAYNLLPPLPARYPNYPSPLPHPQYSSNYQSGDSATVPASNTYPGTGIYPDAGKFMSPDTGLYSVTNPDNYTLDASAIGMDGIPPLNAFEESQYEFLDVLLGHGSAGVPFGLVNDAIAGFGWM